MLTTVVTELTSLTLRQLVFVSFVPVLAFALVNGLILYLEFEWFQDWVEPQISSAWRILDSVALAIALAIFAYMLSGLAGFLKQTLEGQFLRKDSAVARFLRRRQHWRLRELSDARNRVRDSARELRRKREDWVAQLRTQGDKGRNSAKNEYDGASAGAATIDKLRADRAEANELRMEDIERAITELGAALAVNNVGMTGTGATENLLDRDWTDLLALLDYAKDDWLAREVALADEIQVRFGTRVAPAPTAFGNVAAAIQDYGLTRYNLSLAAFWSRLQPILQKDTEFHSSLQAAKAQLDFLVNCFWLSAVTTVFWLVVLPFTGHSVWLYLLVAVLGPLVAWMCYVAAVENYVAFGEVVRAAIDLHRFELLDALSLARPPGLRDERALWDAIGRITSYGQEGVDLSYRHGKKAEE
jgi:hypothetical protein